MVSFKVNVSDPANGKSVQVSVEGHHANALVGKKIGEEIDGLFVKLPGYKLKVTGGSDKDGFVMRKDMPGIGRRRVLLTRSTGMKRTKPGLRRRLTVRGDTVSLDVVQINMVVTKAGPKPITEVVASEGEKKA